MGYYFLLQGIFLTHGWNQSLLHWQVGSWPPSHQGSPCSMIFKLYLLKRPFPHSLGNLIPCSTFLWHQVDFSSHVCISFFSIAFLFSIVFSFFWEELPTLILLSLVSYKSPLISWLIQQLWFWFLWSVCFSWPIFCLIRQLEWREKCILQTWDSENTDIRWWIKKKSLQR